MADAAVDFLLDNLKQLLVYYSDLITDIRSHIESLESDLHVFKAFLKDTVKIRRKDERAKAMVNLIHDVVYEVEDVIDAFVTKATERRSRIFSSKVPLKQSLVDLDNIRIKVEAIKEKVEWGRIDMGILSIDDEYEPDQARPQRQERVGFGDLISTLTKETDDFHVVSVIGAPGLGKTTLAWNFLNSPAIFYKFPIRIWLSISQEFSAKEIFLTILKEFITVNEDIRVKDEDELADMVAAHLEGESFLIVMDDVWRCADWDRLRAVLPDNINKGKVLITSRSQEVGVYASNPRPPMLLRFLSQEESWELLRIVALGTMECPPELVGVGQLIARDCNGRPLEIEVIGGILAAECSTSNITTMRRVWEKVSKQVRAYFKEDDPQDRTKNFVYLNYEKLPHHLRPCFLYLGIFPEGYEIPVSKLIRLWIGEGFIRQSHNCCLEETAEKYLKDLINRNLVGVVKLKPDGKVKTCRIHDSLRDFCRTEAEYENKNFLKEIRFHDGVFAPPISALHKYRRLSIHSNCLDFITSKPFGPSVRSFVSFSKDAFNLPIENIPDILEAFKLLRVLDVKPIKLTRLGTHIFQLIHLRYIALSLNLSTLHPKFSQLRNIQTLIVDTTSSTLEVKADIWNMYQLRHFKTNASAILPKPSEDNKHGAELQTLGMISVESCTAELFERACNLKKLGIRGQLALLLEGKIVSFDTLAKMIYLEKLKLVNDVHPRPASEGQLCGLPQPHQFPSKLRSLTLSATFLDWNFMSTLGLLENLEVLKLKDKAFMGSIWQAVDGGFQRLEFLQIEETDLTFWEASSHHFPRLRELVLKNCEKLLGIPIILADVASFQMLELYVCKSATASAKKIHEAKKKTQAWGSEFKLSISPPE